MNSGANVSFEATRDALRATAAATSRLQITGAAFSAILPGTRLLPHCGPTNERLIVHVGLSVPQPGQARLRLGGPPRVVQQLLMEGTRASGEALSLSTNPIELTWREGEAFVFDDSFAHEVEFEATGETGAGKGRPRIILLLTIRNPDLEPGAGPLCEVEL
eukprot:5505272-Prymnesium_polylepis.1